MERQRPQCNQPDCWGYPLLTSLNLGLAMSCNLPCFAGFATSSSWTARWIVLGAPRLRARRVIVVSMASLPLCDTGAPSTQMTPAIPLTRSGPGPLRRGAQPAPEDKTPGGPALPQYSLSRCSKTAFSLGSSSSGVQIRLPTGASPKHCSLARPRRTGSDPTAWNSTSLEGFARCDREQLKGRIISCRMVLPDCTTRISRPCYPRGAARNV